MKRLLALILCAVLLYPCAALAEDAQIIGIGTPEQLLNVKNKPDASYILTADLDMTGVAWVPFAFTGTLDGAGHAILNLTVTQTDPEKGKTVDGLHRGYDTAFAGLFSRLVGGTVKNLTLLGLNISVETEDAAFVGGIAAFADNAAVENCSVSGRMYCRQGGNMCGVGGILGFGTGNVTASSADVTLVLTDTNTRSPSEAFLGGVCACGYPNVESCTVTLDGYLSAHGYVHSGGLIGMDHIHERKLEDKVRTRVRFSTVDACITFFEDSPERRAYCKPFVGEKSNDLAVVAKNEEVRFEKVETDDYTKELLPEVCTKPVYTDIVTKPTGDSFGFTTHTCKVCGYRFTDRYTKKIG